MRSPAEPLFSRVLFGLLLTAVPLVSQSSLEWRADIGLRYFSRNPLVSSPASWRYAQGIADFSLSGHVWDPRFMRFDIGGNFNYTDYGGKTASPDLRYLGYRLESRFFPESKFSFGLRYLRNDMGTAGKDSETFPLKYALKEKGLDLSLTRVKHLPSVRLAYVDRSYRSSVSDSPRDERDNRLNLDLNKTAGISAFNLNYRRERYENQVIERDRSHENLRVTERLQIKGGTTVWFDGILTKNTLALPGGWSFENDYRQLSGNALSRLSEKLRGNVRYAYVRNVVDGRDFSVHTARGAFHYSLRDNLTLSPLFSYSRSEVESPEGADVLKDARAGARLTWDEKWKAVSWRTHLELVYHRQDSRRQGNVRDLAQAFGASVSVGDLNSFLGSLSYNYSGADAEISIPGYGDPLFYYGIGTSLDRHSVRLELRSRALRPLDAYLYSRYDTYVRELYGQGLVETTTSHHGMRAGLGRLSLSADFSFNDLKAEVMSARYATLTSTLDFDFSRSLDFRAQFVQRNRRDVLTGRESHRSLSLFVNYNFGRFTASLIYQNLAWELDGPLRRSDVLSLTMTRSFGTRR